MHQIWKGLDGHGGSKLDFYPFNIQCWKVNVLTEVGGIHKGIADLHTIAIVNVNIFSIFWGDQFLEVLFPVLRGVVMKHSKRRFP